MAEPDCAFCAANRKSCKSCGKHVCPKHVCSANGCCERCLAFNQQNATDGRCTTQEEDDQLAAAGGPEAGIYGEMTTVGFRSLARRLEMGVRDTYVDLGSGLGRTVLQAAGEFGVARAVGIELAGSRHELAQAALRQQPSLVERVTLVQADCAASDLWEGDGACASATVCFAASLFFGETLMERLKARVEACEACRAVATLKRWEQPPRGFAEQEPPEVCETSWTAPVRVRGDGQRADEEQQRADSEAGCPVHVYVRG